MLTDRQKKFAEEYLIDLNKTRAAERAGYKDPNFGRQLMAKPNVLAYVRELQEKQQKRTEITQDMVLNELAAVAFANGTDFAKIKKQGAFASIDFIPTDDLTLSKKAAIVGIKETSAGIEIKLADKLRALELLGKHIGMFVDKLKIEGAIPVVIKDDLDEDD